MELSWNWEVLKPDLIGGSTYPIFVCIGYAQMMIINKTFYSNTALCKSHSLCFMTAVHLAKLCHILPSNDIKLG